MIISSEEIKRVIDGKTKKKNHWAEMAVNVLRVLVKTENRKMRI
jgi:hypothetical protein